MNQYILIHHIKVQDANAISGFTWGFPAITHFLGFTHNLSLKMSRSKQYSDITLSGCAVVAHEHQSHTYRSVEQKEYPKGSGKYIEIADDLYFTQMKNPAYLEADVKKVVKGGAPSVIEEGKMNMTVSLLISYEGTLGNRIDGFKVWLEKNCYTQRLAGGTILNIKEITPYTVSEDDVRVLMRKLLPGFVLMDRSDYLKKHYESLLEKDTETELLDAWLDFSALKQKARPKSDLIVKHFQGMAKENPENGTFLQILTDWQNHLNIPYEEGKLPENIKEYFASLPPSKANEKVLAQWKSYCEPDEKTDADWEYIPKPNRGYLVPIMTGYKALTQVYKNHAVENTRDNETDVCFVESVHSVGEWLSAHRINSVEKLKESVWNYAYEESWYLCKQNINNQNNESQSRLTEDDEDIYS